MQLRRQLIQDVRSGATPLTELAAAYGISRKTAYKWLARYEAGGLPDLEIGTALPPTSGTVGKRRTSVSSAALASEMLSEQGRNQVD